MNKAFIELEHLLTDLNIGTMVFPDLQPKNNVKTQIVELSTHQYRLGLANLASKLNIKISILPSVTNYLKPVRLLQGIYFVLNTYYVRYPSPHIRHRQRPIIVVVNSKTLTELNHYIPCSFFIIPPIIFLNFDRTKVSTKKFPFIEILASPLEQVSLTIQVPDQYKRITYKEARHDLNNSLQAVIDTFIQGKVLMYKSLPDKIYHQEMYNFYRKHLNFYNIHKSECDCVLRSNSWYQCVQDQVRSYLPIYSPKHPPPGYNGRNFVRVAMKISPPNTIYLNGQNLQLHTNKSILITKQLLRNITGYYCEILKMILYDYDFEVVIQSDSVPFGNLDKKTGSLNGIVGLVEKEEFDIAIPISATMERSHHVNFLEYLSFDPLAMLFVDQVEQKFTLQSLFSVYEGLTANLWFLWFISLIIFSFVLSKLNEIEQNFNVYRLYIQMRSEQNYVGEVISPTFCKDLSIKYNVKNIPGKRILYRISRMSRLPKLLSFGKIFLYSIAKFTGANYGIDTKYFLSRFIMLLWWSLCTVVLICFTANTAAHATVKDKTVILKSFAELAERSDLVPMMFNQSSTHTIFKFSKEYPYPEVLAKAKLISNYEEMMYRVFYENGVFISAMDSIVYIANTYCGLKHLSIKSGYLGQGMAIPFDFLHSNVLSARILKLSESGVASRFRQQFWQKKSACKRLFPTKDYIISNTDNFFRNNIGYFISIIIGLIICLIILVIELFYFKFKNKH
ncbi:hypothetical protein SNEBB_000495 [Seison nebaliae]|nr:hypothetical protein SNEBB_000495 [Seison nebaliae]